MSMRHKPVGKTVLSGKLDQAALYGVLMRIRDLGIKFLSVKRIGATGPLDDTLHAR
jgi:hypothetical protein